MQTIYAAARLERHFTTPQAQVLAEEFEANQRDLVKAADFNELKEIVRSISLTQQHTDIKMGEMVEAQTRTNIKIGELVEAQKRTEARVEELAVAQTQLAEAQQRTEEEVRKLAVSQQSLQHQQQSLQREVGGVANAIGYMLENEAYRHLPKFMAERHGINVSNRFLRAQVGAEEINVLAEGHRGSTPILLVGEAKSRLAAADLTQLKRKIKEVEKHHPAAAGREIVPVMVVHFARKKELEKAARSGVIVVQSHEW